MSSAEGGAAYAMTRRLRQDLRSVPLVDHLYRRRSGVEGWTHLGIPEFDRPNPVVTSRLIAGPGGLEAP